MNTFQLPIFYLKNKELLDENIIRDLEFLDVNENNESRQSLLETVINPQSDIGKENLYKLCEYYTNDIDYLKQTQNILSTWKSDDVTTREIKKELYNKFNDLWKNIKLDENFIDRYYYVDVEYFKFLNNSSSFLQLLSLYNLISPVLSIILPIILLLVPFFMLKFNGIKITLESYYKILVNIFSKHALGNMFKLFGDISWEQRFYALVSIAFYFFSIYQNSLVCYRFYNNFSAIHDDLFTLKKYLSITIENIEKIELVCKNTDKYYEFICSLSIHKDRCMELKSRLENITDLNIYEIRKKTQEIGYVMKYFYEIHTNEMLEETINFTFGFNAYMEHMEGIVDLHREKLVNKCKFGKKIKMTEVFYPHLIHTSNLVHSEPICNDIYMKKNMIITGPNASGKTTILKSVLFNLIFSQSFGCGFYSKAVICPYDKIHCYLNIPDTSGRDSLFQAEARRCKEIIDSLEDNKKHFCIFDELFSGTNPNEACASSYGFVKYMIKQKNIDFILTTHLLDLCKNLDSCIENRNMNVIQKNDFDFEYTYKLNKGMSTIKGGLKVLCDLSYPISILEASNKYLKNN